MTKDRWREVRRHVMRMRDALPLGQLTVAGEPLTSVTPRKLEGYVRFGLGEK
jgi:predicted Co/Zn/Cd cation transporter (cation efflux family)